MKKPPIDKNASFPLKPHEDGIGFLCEEVIVRVGKGENADIAVIPGFIAIYICSNCSNTHMVIQTKAEMSVMLDLNPEDAETLGQRLISPPPLPTN